MAGGQFIIDASVIVKWLHSDRENNLEQANHILLLAERGELTLFVSDITAHEVLNALICGKHLRWRDLEEAVENFFQLPIILVETNLHRAAAAATIAVEQNITFYDAVYCAIAFERGIPLITANSKHQRPMTGVNVIPLGEWLTLTSSF